MLKNLKDQNKKEFSYHYHDFHKILILVNGDITNCIEGRSYQLAPNDIVLVHAGEVHRPIIQSESPYERIIIYVSPDFLKKYKEPDCDLSHCLKQDAAEQSLNTISDITIHQDKDLVKIVIVIGKLLFILIFQVK